MKDQVSNFYFVEVNGLDGALSLLKKEKGKYMPFAGGTDIMVALQSGTLRNRNFINISNFTKLKGIEESEDEISLGALTTYSQIIQNDQIREEFPLLSQAAQEVASVAIQNKGTIGGNIANASPSGDLLPVLLIYNAKIDLISKNGVRTLDYEKYHLDYKKTQLNDDELIYKIRLPKGLQSNISMFRKVGSRKAMTISKVCFAGRATLQRNNIVDIHLALGAVAPVPLKCKKTEAILRGRVLSDKLIMKAKDTLLYEVKPISDLRSTKNYRKQVSVNLFEEFINRMKYYAGMDTKN